MAERMTKITSLLKYIVVFILLLAGIAGAYSWFYPKVQIVTKWREAETLKTIIKIKKVEIPVEKIIVIEKEKVVEKLKLDIKPSDEILAVAEIPPYEGKTSVAAIFDKNTAETKINYRHEPLPFISFENQKELYLKAGYALSNRGLGYNVEVGGEWKFLRIANFHLGLFGQADINQNIFAGVKVSYRW